MENLKTDIGNSVTKSLKSSIRESVRSGVWDFMPALLNDPTASTIWRAVRDTEWKT